MLQAVTTSKGSKADGLDVGGQSDSSEFLTKKCCTRNLVFVISGYRAIDGLTCVERHDGGLAQVHHSKLGKLVGDEEEVTGIEGAGDDQLSNLSVAHLLGKIASSVLYSQRLHGDAGNCCNKQ